MKVTTIAIKDSQQNIYGAEFTAVGGQTSLEVGRGNQSLTYSSIGDGLNPTSIAGTFHVSPTTGGSTLNLGLGAGVSFNVDKVENPIHPERNDVRLGVVVTRMGKEPFSKSYNLHKFNSKGEWVETEEIGAYNGAGYTITMPTRVADSYTATFQSFEGLPVKAEITITLSEDGEGTVTARGSVSFTFEDKEVGFTKREFTHIKNSLLKFEGRTSYMYLDSEGKVTVGVGFMIPDEADALSYPFIDEDEKLAAPEQIQAEWRTIHGMKKGHIASWYEDSTELSLPYEFIEQKMVQRVDQTFTELKKKFSDFAEYPSPARLALQDMMYNLGYTKFSNFEKMIDAVKKLDWTTAASESHRLKIREDRNTAVHDLFMSAAGSGDF